MKNGKDPKGLKSIDKKKYLTDWYNSRRSQYLKNNPGSSSTELNSNLLNMWNTTVYSDPKLQNIPYGSSGVYQPDQNNIFVKDEMDDSVIVHELDHSINKSGKIDNRKIKNILKKRGLSTDEYWKSPEEIRSRLMQYRYENNILPEDKIESLPVNHTRFLFQGFDDDTVIDLLNNLTYDDQSSESSDKLLTMNKKNKKNIPAHAFGLEAFSQVAGSAIPMIAGMAGENDFTNSLSSVATGAAQGAAFGPIGIAAGGALGAVSSIFSNRQRRLQKRRQREAVEKQDILRTQSNLNAVSNEMATDFELKNPIVPTFNYGGTTYSNLAYVDDNEIIQYPNGDTKKVVDKSGKTDNVLTKLPNNTTVFSDAMNVPGTQRTYAEQAEKLTKIQDRKYKNQDRFARTSKELNDKFVDKEMNKLKMNQFIKKQMTGRGKQAFKLGTPAHANGIEDIQWNSIFAQQNPDPGNISPISISSMIPKAPSITNVINQKSVSSAMGTFPQKSAEESSSTFGNIGGGIQNALTDYLSLSPYRYNTSEGNTYDVVDTINNPYANSINRTMRARRISMTPIRESINRQRAISRANARNITGTGQNMAYNLASEAMANRMEADAIVNNQQLNNQYDADYSNTLNNLGQQYANSTAYAQDMTARNKAAAANMRGEASRELKQWAQNKALMGNQARRDKGLLGALTPFLREGFDSTSLQNILNQFS